MIKQISIIVLGGIAVIFLLNMFDVVDKSLISAALLAGAINIANSLAANFLFEKSYKESNSTFLMYNLGGMVFRLFFLLVVVFIVIKFLKIDKYGFIFLFFIFYFISLFLEINYFRIKVKKQDKSK